MKRRYLILAVCGLALLALYLGNASWRGHPINHPTILAHRGLHQTFSKSGLTRQTCTAVGIDPPRHGYLENTLPSIRSAFDLGADMVELDIHPTTDGQFVVFHDWTLECRTNGRGVTREHSLKDLQALDIGWGYTADGGKTYPFRGKGVGLMPSLEDVLKAWPDRSFLVNIKSNDAHEADLIDAWLRARPGVHAERLVFVGGARPTERLHELRPELRAMSSASAKACLIGYELLGWTGHVPAPCRNTLVFVPVSGTWSLWGWPNLFLERMRGAGAEVYVGGEIEWTLGTLDGLDEPAKLSGLPRNWRGGVSTDRIDLIGPVLKGRNVRAVSPVPTPPTDRPPPVR